MPQRTLVWFSAVGLGAALSATPVCAAQKSSNAANPVACAELATDPAFGLAGNPVITTKARATPASTSG